MINQRLITFFSLLMIVFSFSYSDAQSSAGNSQTKAGIKTKITKDILKKRLAGKNVQFVENSDQKPNPLSLSLKIVEGGNSPKISLNGTAYQFDELVQKLHSIFKEREENNMFQAGTNIIDKRVTLAAGKTDINFYNKENIRLEDFERLIEELHKEGIDQIYLSFT